MHLAWPGLIIFGVFAGAAASAALVARSRWDAFWRLASFVGLLATTLAVYSVGRAAGRSDTAVAAAFLAIGAALGGFALGASLVPSFTRLPKVAGRAKPSIGHGGPPGPLAVVLLAEGQPETYDPSVVTQEYALLADTEVPAPSDVLRLFAYLSERARYRTRGPSPARPAVRGVASRLEGRLRDARCSVRVHVAWLKGAPRLADAVAQAHADGAAVVVVVHLAIGESAALESARHGADPVLASLGLRLVEAPPLWPEMALARTLVDRTLAALPDGPRPHDGVVVVGDGQPWQWDRAYPASCEQSTTFLQRVRAMLVAEGIPDLQVRSAWLDWEDPGVTEAVRHLAAVGCDRIVVLPATMPADSLETIIDLPAAIEQAAVDRSVRLTVLGAWGDDPVVADVLADVTLEGLRAAEEADAQ